MKKPSQQQTWIGLALAVLTFATAYLGLDKYQQVAPDIKVNVTGAPARSDQDIQVMIDRAVNQKMKDHTKGGRFH